MDNNCNIAYNILFVPKKYVTSRINRLGADNIAAGTIKNLNYYYYKFIFIKI